MTNTLAARALGPVLAAAGAYHLGLALFMAVAPDTFHADFADYGVLNEHYVRDLATYGAAQGLALLAAWRLPSWRVPVLAFVVAQYALHVVNHAFDVNEADSGTSNLVALVLLGALLGWMLLTAVREERAR